MRVLLQLWMLLMAVAVTAGIFLLAVLFLTVWGLRALWARLTGQPVSPWAFRWDRQQVWQRYRAETARQRAPAPGRAAEAEVIDADVTDVEPKYPEGR